MVKALVPRQRKPKSVFVSQKYNSNLTVLKKGKSLQGKSILCTAKYFQSDGVDVDEDQKSDE